MVFCQQKAVNGKLKEQVREVWSIICRSWNYTTNVASRVCDITLPPRDQMDMGVINGLPRDLAAIHADIETCHRSISCKDIVSNLIEQDAEGTAFWLE